jgi:hypothetical protein
MLVEIFTYGLIIAYSAEKLIAAEKDHQKIFVWVNQKIWANTIRPNLVCGSFI